MTTAETPAKSETKRIPITVLKVGGGKEVVEFDELVKQSSQILRQMCSAWDTTNPCDGTTCDHVFPPIQRPKWEGPRKGNPIYDAGNQALAKGDKGEFVFRRLITTVVSRSKPKPMVLFGPMLTNYRQLGHHLPTLLKSIIISKKPSELTDGVVFVGNEITLFEVKTGNVEKQLLGEAATAQTGAGPLAPRKTAGTQLDKAEKFFRTLEEEIAQKLHEDIAQRKCVIKKVAAFPLLDNVEEFASVIDQFHREHADITVAAKDDLLSGSWCGWRPDSGTAVTETYKAMCALAVSMQSTLSYNHKDLSFGLQNPAEQRMTVTTLIRDQSNLKTSFIREKDRASGAKRKQDDVGERAPHVDTAYFSLRGQLVGTYFMFMNREQWSCWAGGQKWQYFGGAFGTGKTLMIQNRGRVQIVDKQETCICYFDSEATKVLYARFFADTGVRTLGLSDDVRHPACVLFSGDDGQTDAIVRRLEELMSSAASFSFFADEVVWETELSAKIVTVLRGHRVRLTYLWIADMLTNAMNSTLEGHSAAADNFMQICNYTHEQLSKQLDGDNFKLVLSPLWTHMRSSVTLFKFMKSRICGLPTQCEPGHSIRGEDYERVCIETNYSGRPNDLSEVVNDLTGQVKRLVHCFCPVSSGSSSYKNVAIIFAYSAEHGARTRLSNVSSELHKMLKQKLRRPDELPDVRFGSLGEENIVVITSASAVYSWEWAAVLVVHLVSPEIGAEDVAGNKDMLAVAASRPQMRLVIVDVIVRRKTMAQRLVCSAGSTA